MTPKKGSEVEVEVEANNDRRKFLAICGNFAIATPPATTLLLSTSLTWAAFAGSGGSGNGKNDFGNIVGLTSRRSVIKQAHQPSFRSHKK
jgi:hypothetical protein